MNLVFLDRSSAAQPAPGVPFLNVQPSGGCVLSSGAVAHCQLHAQQWVSFAQDTDTNRFFLVFGAVRPGRKPFALRIQKGKPAARAFSAAAPARLLLETFGQTDAKSLRLLVGAPVTHDSTVLYPLLAEGAAVPALPEAAPEIAHEAALEAAPEVVAIATGSVAAAPDAPAALPAKASVFTPEQDAALLDEANSPSALAREWGMPAQPLYNRRSYLKKHAPPAKPVVAAVEPVREDTSAPVRKTFGLVQRSEELTAYWYERDIARATVTEMGEILNLLPHVARDKRSFEMGVVLERAEKEHSDRLRGAGKEVRRG